MITTRRPLREERETLTEYLIERLDSAHLWEVFLPPFSNIESLSRGGETAVLDTCQHGPSI